MQCPVDGETLVMSERSGVEIDYCPKCRGVWLDRGELDKILERATAEESPRPPATAHAAEAPAHPAAAPHLREQSHFDRGDSRYRDDRGQREEYRRDDGYRGDYRRDDDDRRPDGSYRKKKRESFLSDLFDF
ncbi:MAG TPA: zf-TFIIB domain-containing protein [Paracoccus sp. (in: a-proteobacteria)]|nr:zf-TFIIB domain-containing protein [Paracoccus sp. (in: a-proteobacteria)]